MIGGANDIVRRAGPFLKWNLMDERVENGMAAGALELGKTALGIELGSTRIKAVLIGPDNMPIASGEYDWENRIEDGIWTYDLEQVWEGLQGAYRQLAEAVEKKFGIQLTKVGALGFSGMMHGYLPFDASGEQLVSFRTWRNTTTEQAAEALTNLFEFNIPQRWSIAHLYQAMLNKEMHVEKVDFLTTLAGYVHWKLTGEKVLGIGEAAGMFPIDSDASDYDPRMVKKFNQLAEKFSYGWTLEEILPKVQLAGAHAGYLTEEGAKLLDPTGVLQAGIPLCPPEGDAGTGMTATNTVAEHTGNVSAGTSIFAMIVLEKELSDYYTEIDMVTTPAGKPVAMVHCNNFTSDINAWARLLAEFAEVIGTKVEMGDVFNHLFNQAMKADPDVGGLANCSYYSGEPITRFEEGRPLFVRMPDSNFNLPNFMRTQIYSALATLKIGMDILTTEEKVQIESILGHGGFFKTEKVGQQLMADAFGVPVSVMRTAGEGGPWGMALLAAYSINKKEEQTLENYLAENVFATEEIKTIAPSMEGMESFSNYMNRNQAILEVERVAVDVLK